MPSTGTPRATASWTATSSRCSRMRRMASPKLPTPGSTTASAPATASGARTTVTSAPRSSRAFVALRRLLIS